MFRLRLLTPFLFVLVSCSRPPSVESVHTSVVSAIQQGELEQAQTQLDKAFGKGVLLKPPANPDSLLSARISQSDADRLRLLQSEVLLEQGKAPAALDLLDHLKDPGDPESHLRWLVNRAVALSKTDKLDQTRKQLDDVDRDTGNLASSEPVLKARLLRGSLLIRAGQFGRADAMFQETATTAQRAGLPFYRAAALLNLSASSLRRRRYDESVEYAEEALKSGNRRLEAAIHNNLGIAYFRLGDQDKAERHETQAIALSRKAGDTRTLADALGGIANVYMESINADGELDKHKLGEAVKSLEEAIATSKRIGAKGDAFRLAGNLATAHIIAKEWDAAEQSNKDAYDLLNQLEHPEKPLLLQFNAAEIAVGRDQLQQAEKLYRALIDEKPEGFIEWDAHARLGKVYATQKKLKEAKHEYELALAAVEGARSNLKATESRVTFNNHLIRFFWNYVDLLVDSGRNDEALEVVEYSRARVMAEKLGLEPGSFHQVQAATFQAYARRTGDVMLSYWLTPDRSFVWVVNANGIHMSVLPDRKTIADAISVYGRMIEQDLRDPVAENLPQGGKLTDLLIGPVKQYIEGAGRIIVVPDYALHTLNLETLPVASKDGIRYWIETAELAVTPSLVLLSEAPSSVKASAKPNMLLFGAPTSSRAEYPELPGAKSEIDGIGQQFEGNNRIVVGSAATPRAFLDSMPANYSMIHFAAHAEANTESPLDSAVILSDDGRDFKLYAREISNLKLSANLVTISACRSAGAHLYHGEGMVGFAWAFMQSGVRTVIAGLWDVDDNYSSQIMTNLYQGIASGKRPSTALRLAKLTLLQSKGTSRKPVYWAPFQAYLR